MNRFFNYVVVIQYKYNFYAYLPLEYLLTLNRTSTTGQGMSCVTLYYEVRIS